VNNDIGLVRAALNSSDNIEDGVAWGAFNRILDRLDAAEREREQFQKWKRDHLELEKTQRLQIDCAHDEVMRLREWEACGREWLEKTEWVQKAGIPPRWLGWHRADIMRETILLLGAEKEKLIELLDRARDMLPECGLRNEIDAAGYSTGPISDGGTDPRNKATTSGVDHGTSLRNHPCP